MTAKKEDTSSLAETLKAIDECLKSPLVLESPEERKKKLEEQRRLVNEVIDGCFPQYAARFKQFSI